MSENPVVNSGLGNSLKKIPERIPLYQYRYTFFVFVAAFTLTVPFISINGNGLLRMSFLHHRLEFLGMAFDTSQLYVIPFMIFMFAAFVLLITSLGGRVWCGWGCPQTMFRFVYRDLIQGYLLKLKHPRNKNKKLVLNTLRKKALFVLGILLYACVAFLGTANLLWYFIEPGEFFNVVLRSPEEYPFVFGFWIGMSLFFIIDITLIKENFCKFACPYARIQSVFFDKDTALVIYDKNRGDNKDGSKGMKNFAGLRDKSGDCTGCLACVKVCPTGIDIRDGLQLGCVECLECVDACYPIMARKQKKNLINWTTEGSMHGQKWRAIRPRTVFYAFIILASLVALLYLSFTRSEVVLNINRTSELYFIDEKNHAVENYYVLLLANDTNKALSLSFRIDSKIPAKIKRSSENFTLYPNEKIKKILTLSADGLDGLSKEDSVVPEPLIIRLIDQNDPSSVLAKRNTVFFIPDKFLK